MLQQLQFSIKTNNAGKNGGVPMLFYLCFHRLKNDASKEYNLLLVNFATTLFSIFNSDFMIKYINIISIAQLNCSGTHQVYSLSCEFGGVITPCLTPQPLLGKRLDCHLVDHVVWKVLKYHETK